MLTPLMNVLWLTLIILGIFLKSTRIVYSNCLKTFRGSLTCEEIQLQQFWRNPLFGALEVFFVLRCHWNRFKSKLSLFFLLLWYSPVLSARLTPPAGGHDPYLGIGLPLRFWNPDPVKDKKSPKVFYTDESEINAHKIAAVFCFVYLRLFGDFWFAKVMFSK